MRSAALSYQVLLGIIPLFALFFWYLNTIQVTDRWVKRFQWCQNNALRFLLLGLSEKTAEK
ncbi:MAG: hypothetical protein EB120_02090 [Proteobacteria bacterium]|nr:hypothetical protein [Pseudomonadota bacterium]NDG25951.1 hypothetical protein [Pseudomonadota bacterium]